MVILYKPMQAVGIISSGIVELMPGDVAIGETGDRVRTLLGSCVSVILTDPRRTIGTMCHIMYVGKPSLANKHNTCYGNVAMFDMFTRLRSKGINPELCDAYVFGGGNMFPQFFETKHVGASNVEWVMDYLNYHQIPVVDYCLGGRGYRKVSWTVGAAEPLVETVFAEQGISHDR